MKDNRDWRWLLAAVLLMGGCRDVFGSGFAIFTQDASATGRVTSVAAHSDSPSSVFFNPALIHGLEGTQVEIGTTILWPSHTMKSASGGRAFETKSEAFYPSHFYITRKLNERVSLGMGVFNNFGLATRWDGEWEGRYLATNSDLTVFTFNPVVCVRATDKLAVAGGIDILTLDVTLEKKINLTVFPDASQRFDADGRGVGFNLGVLYDLTDYVALGASYRSRIKTRVEGSVTHALPPGSGDSVGPLFPDTRGRTDMTFPAVLQLGIAYKGLGRLVLEGDFHFENWSCFKEQRITLDQPVAGFTTMSVERNWKNSYALGVGADYRVHDAVSLSAGYLHSGNPVPDETFEPAIPDADIHIFNAGAVLRHRAVSVGIAYGYQLSEERVKANSIDDNPFDGLLNPATSANGRYDTGIHVLGISLTFRL